MKHKHKKELVITLREALKRLEDLSYLQSISGGIVFFGYKKSHYEHWSDLNCSPSEAVRLIKQALGKLGKTK